MNKWITGRIHPHPLQRLLTSGFFEAEFPSPDFFAYRFFLLLSKRRVIVPSSFLPCSSIKAGQWKSMCLFCQHLLLFKSKLHLQPRTAQHAHSPFSASCYAFFSSVSSIFRWDHAILSTTVLPASHWAWACAFLHVSNTIICIGFIRANSVQSQKSETKIKLAELFITEREAMTQWSLDSSRIITCMQDAVCIRHFLRKSRWVVAASLFCNAKPI